tara:strand:+ start:11971 stop:13929 length:1959 start_codon:yes stop_codon:yes gene_type:complete
MRKNSVWVYDIETYPNIFTFVFRKVGERELKIFEISSRKNQIRELILFLKTRNLRLIGYNNVAFDYPVLHYILKNPNTTLQEMFDYVQESIIGSEFPVIPEWNIVIPQVDLYKICHYDNMARATSLKWLEFTLRWEKLQDLPFKPGTIIPTDKFDYLIEYNINDVDFTFRFLDECMDAIMFRQEMSKVLDKNVMNYSDVKIGELLNRQTYERLSGIPYKHFKKLRSYRSVIKVSDLIPSYIKYKTKYMQDFLKEISSKTFKIDDKFERHLRFGGISMKFAKGGLHSEDTPKVFKCKPGWTLKEKDVGSMYPASMINGKMYPQHLGEAWYEGIKSLYEERAYELKPQMKKLDKKSDAYRFLDSKQNAYKLAMNGGGYGKTGSEYSWQYDPLIMLKVTFKGQLSLMMLMEEYSEMGVELISANTDGVVIHYPDEMEDEVNRVHKEWETTTMYILEDTSYAQIIFRDVNNYVAEIIDEQSKERVKMKFKGCFEFDQELHKNNSQRIVQIALMEYFIHGVPVEDVIRSPGYEFENTKGKREKTSIYDYCRGVKKMKTTFGYAFISPTKREDIPDKVCRYYISNSNTKLYKIYNESEDRIAAINKGYNVTPFMNYRKEENYDINYQYYINECNKIIEPIERGTLKIGYEEPEQLNLF